MFGFVLQHFITFSDTLIDCQDPDCCSLRSCSRTSQCRGGLDPSNEVTNSQGRSPTLPTASFFDRVKFLVHRNGVQINSALSVFEPRYDVVSFLSHYSINLDVQNITQIICWSLKLLIYQPPFFCDQQII